MSSKGYQQTDTYRPNRLRLICLTLKSLNYNRTMLKWVLIVAAIAFLGIKIVSQLLAKNPELLNSLKEAGSALGLVEPTPRTSSTTQSSTRLKGEGLHLLDLPAKFYMESSQKSAASPAEPDRPWLLQGVVDEVTKGAENRRVIKQWIHSLKQKPPADELDLPDEP